MILPVLVLRQLFPAKSLVEPLLIDLLDRLYDLEQSGTSGNSVGFQ